MNDLVVTSILSMGGMAVFFSGVLAFANEKLRVQGDPSVDRLVSLLPGINCAACGFLSCHDFAENVVRSGADASKCRVVSEEARKKIYELLGKEGAAVYPNIPLVRCAAEWDDKKKKGTYRGIGTCAGANLVFGAGLECQYGCMGLGDCTAACQFDAFHMVNGLPKLDQAKCTGCGLCVRACPRNIIIMQEKRNEKLTYVACNSHDDMARTRKVCSVGCIACGICVKLSKGELFKMEDNISEAVYSKQLGQTAVSAVQAKCPTKVIKDV